MSTILCGWVSCLSVSLLLFGFSGQAQPNNEQVWQGFLGFLKAAPAASGPLELVQGYQKDLAADGVAAPEVSRRLGVVLRLMRDRSDAWPLMFDKIYASDDPNFNTKPNALLMSAVEDRSPGRALEVAMGQGRNAIGLAKLGWDVTGFDVSAEGLAVAKANAARSGVKVEAIQSSDEAFDFGINRWDLIAFIYAPVAISDAQYVKRLRRSLRPGGLIVVESFASDSEAENRRPVDIDPQELLQAFTGFRIVRFEDTDGIADWDPQKTSLVRLVAQKQ